MAHDMVSMTEQEFRSRFKLAWSLKSNLKTSEFYDILTANDFDERSAMRQVFNLAAMATVDSDTSEEDSDEFPERVPYIEEDKGMEGLSSRKLLKKNISNKIEDDRDATAVTKWISKLAGGLFVRTLLVCDGEKVLHDKDGLKAAAEAENMTMEALIDITSDPEAVRRAGWSGREETINVSLAGHPIWKDPKSGRVGYSSAVIDGVIINPGDFVTVRPGSDDHGLAQSSNKTNTPNAAASIWFARIAYLFDDKEGPSAHMHWLSHGGDTILGGTAGARELFVLYRCDDAPLGSIAGKVSVDFVGKDDHKGHDGLGPVELNYHAVNDYFYRLAYSEAGERFEQIQDLNLQSRIEKPFCSCCEMLANEDLSKSTRILGTSKSNVKVEHIGHRGVTYGLYDFVYLTPKDSSAPYIIAQITEIRAGGLRRWIKSSPSRSDADLKVTVQVFQRHDDLLEPYLDEFESWSDHRKRDCRRLYRDSARFLSVSVDRLDGKCVVRHIDTIDDLSKFKDLDDTFYVTHQIPNTNKSADLKKSLLDLKPLLARELKISADSEESLVIEISRIDAFVSNGRKLRAMEVFAGAGGLATGLDQSRAVATEWAIEYDTKAAHAFKQNFPSAKVYNHDANVLLRQAVEEFLGISKGELFGLNGKPLPRMPWPGEVDFLYGGPPCQDFSMCNRYQKANSIKNSLLATYLSYVDHYQPKYFLLENVQDLLHHRLGSSQVSIHTTQGGIEMGSAKFIMRALTSLGYQAQFSVLQAGEHGTPQSRMRVFFWGSKPGYPLPKYPEPTNVFTGRAPKSTRRTRRSAPHYPITVGDAISDLPSFDWTMKVPGESAIDRALRNSRAEMILQVPLVEGTHAKIGSKVQTYSSHVALSEYQRELRRNCTTASVHNHYTCRWNDETMIRVMRIPMRPGANHLDIPAEEDMYCLRSELSAAPKHRYYPDRYRRLDYDKPFQTCLCKIDPSGKNGTVLHPSQRRVLTVREQARVQGFPDTFTWADDKKTVPKDMYKQIGNAVPIPVGRALGRELLEVLIQKWEKDMAVAGAGAGAGAAAPNGAAADIIETIEVDDSHEDACDEEMSDGVAVGVSERHATTATNTTKGCSGRESDGEEEDEALHSQRREQWVALTEEDDEILHLRRLMSWK